jgi:hypothetical protein
LVGAWMLLDLLVGWCGWVIVRRGPNICPNTYTDDNTFKTPLRCIAASPAAIPG